MLPAEDPGCGQGWGCHMVREWAHRLCLASGRADWVQEVGPADILAKRWPDQDRCREEK